MAHKEVFDVFKSSFQECLSEHSACAKPNAHMPTRVLMLHNDKPDRVFLHDSKPDEQEHYVALSYSWGKTTQTKLLVSNIDSLKEKGVVTNSLPKTLQDSIVATKELGIKYLWIDSLCIIQDSEEDKIKELSGMANIYKNAAITISAAITSDCGQGFLEDRTDVQLRLDTSICLPFMSTEDPETRQVLDWLYICPEAQMGHKIWRFDEEPINRRAWTYQESTLAPRLLIFGSGPPQWHCKESWKIYGLDIHPDDLPHPICVTTTTKLSTRDGRLIPEETFRYAERPDPPKDEIGLWPSWFPLLENYSRRELSVHTDKLPAISALAAEHQSSDNGEYAAGLWKGSLPRSLLWRRKSDIDNTTFSQHTHRLSWLRTRLFDPSFKTDVVEASNWPLRYIAPTWSPMSSTDPIVFEKAATQNEDEFHTSLVTINDVHTPLTNELLPFGRLDFAYLDLTAPMRSISWEELTTDFVIVRAGEPFAYWDYIVPDDPTYFLYLGKKYGASIAPQMLGDTNMQHPVDEGDVSFTVMNRSTRIASPVKPEPASIICTDADVSFTPTPTPDVKHEVVEAILRDTDVVVPLTPPITPTPPLSKPPKSNRRCCWPSSRQNISPPEPAHPMQLYPFDPNNDEREFWLLEVERSMSPAGLVLKRIHDDIFARVGYFGMNRSLDPEIVYLPGLIQVRGPKTSSFGKPAGMGEWYDSLARRRIYLV